MINLSKLSDVILLHLILALLIFVIFAAILIANSGHFTYALDDAYIHLAMSEEIAKGGYGINTGQYASASSSILFPFLLSWAAPFSFHLYVPLLINIVAFVASVETVRRFLVEYCFGATNQQRVFATILTGILALSMNILGVIFTGMEHSLQILASLLVIYGLIRFLHINRVEWWFVAAIILGPLVRYENLAISLAAIGILACRRATTMALAMFFTCGALIGLYSFFLHRLGLNYLPNSIIVKSTLATDVSSGHIASFIASIGNNFLNQTLGTSEGLTLLALFTVALLRFLLIFRFPASPQEIGIGIFVMLSAGAYMLAGHYEFGRYEAAVYSVTTLGLIFIFRSQIRQFIQNHRAWGVAFLGIFLSGYIGHAFLYWTIFIPIAANNIYEQQYQMHRFVTKFLNGPVAVNDIGCVSYHNDNVVLDLWGLASDEALRAKKSGHPANALAELVKKRRITVAIIYEEWFGPYIPRQWRRIAKLSLSRQRISPAQKTVAFYATDPSQVTAIRQKLTRFAQSLPRGVTMRLL